MFDSRLAVAVHQVVAAERATRNRRLLPIGWNPHLRVATARHHAKTEMVAALRQAFYAACRHV